MKYKDKLIRLNEIMNIRKKLKELEIHDLEDFKELYKQMQDFIKTGNSFTTKIKIKSIDKKLEVILTNNNNIVSYIKLINL